MLDTGLDRVLVGSRVGLRVEPLRRRVSPAGCRTLSTSCDTTSVGRGVDWAASDGAPARRVRSDRPSGSPSIACPTGAVLTCPSVRSRVGVLPFRLACRLSVCRSWFSTRSQLGFVRHAVRLGVECGLAGRCWPGCLLDALPVRLRSGTRLVRRCPLRALSRFVEQGPTRPLTLPGWPGVGLLVGRTELRRHRVGRGADARSARLCRTLLAFASKKAIIGIRPGDLQFLNLPF